MRLSINDISAKFIFKNIFSFRLASQKALSRSSEGKDSALLKKNTDALKDHEWFDILRVVSVMQTIDDRLETSD